MDNLILINKKEENGLDSNYVPDDLVITDNNENNFHNYVNPSLKPMIRKEVYTHFLELQNDARKLGYEIIIDSGFRSYQYQLDIWNDYYKKYYEDFKNRYPNLDDESLKKLVEDYTNKYVAAPGHSEHQTGLSFDFATYNNNVYSDEVEDSPESKWMSENAHKYGFILRYPKGKESITGYNYEEWHFRYVGLPYSEEIYNDNLTLEEYHELLLKK